LQVFALDYPKRVKRGCLDLADPHVKGHHLSFVIRIMAALNFGQLPVACGEVISPDALVRFDLADRSEARFRCDERVGGEAIEELLGDESEKGIEKSAAGRLLSGGRIPVRIPERAERLHQTR